MDYSFRPQWMLWNNFPHSEPTCGRCGNIHPYKICYSIYRTCYKCQRKGHYARVCHTNLTKAKISVNNVTLQQKSNRQLNRDRKRMDKYVKRKNICRELPFYNIRDKNLRNCLDTNSAIKTELKSVKMKLKSRQNKQQQGMCAVQDRLQILESKYMKDISHLNTQILSKENESKQLSKSVDEYKQVLAEKDSRINQLTAQNCKLQQHIDQLYRLEIYDSDGEEICVKDPYDFTERLKRERQDHVMMIIALQEEKKAQLMEIDELKAKNSKHKQTGTLDYELDIPTPFESVNDLVQRQNSKYSSCDSNLKSRKPKSKKRARKH